VAFAAGGALETVEEGVTGVFFHEHSAEAVIDALSRAGALRTAPQDIAAHAQRFSRAAFRDRLVGVIERARSR